MIEYETSEGDVLSDIVYRFYGRTYGAIEVVLSENRELTNYDVFLPKGLKIRLPDVDIKNQKKLIRLWD